MSEKILMEIINTNRPQIGPITVSDARRMVKEAYELGKKSKKCKEDNDNPYNIDYERQTKLDF